MKDKKYKLIVEDVGLSYDKNKILENNGYKIVRIPYFIQLTKENQLKLFGKYVEFNLDFPNGFIHPKAILPMDFCYLGLKRFKEDLDKFNDDEIIDSVNSRLKMLNIEFDIFKIINEEI